VPCSKPGFNSSSSFQNSLYLIYSAYMCSLRQLEVTLRFSPSRPFFLSHCFIFFFYFFTFFLSLSFLPSFLPFLSFFLPDWSLYSLAQQILYNVNYDFGPCYFNDFSGRFSIFFKPRLPFSSDLLSLHLLSNWVHRHETQCPACLEISFGLKGKRWM
jgi:hypothetical protein